MWRLAWCFRLRHFRFLWLTFTDKTQTAGLGTGFKDRMHAMKHQVATFLVALACAFCAACPADAEDSRLMNGAEYKSFLNEVERKLPEWEAALKRIDPAKTNASYAVGKELNQYRDLALMEVGSVRQWVPKERAKHTVSGELALEGFLRSVFDAMDAVVRTEISGGITASSLENYAPEIGELVGRIVNDVIARVELLEKGTCP